MKSVLKGTYPDSYCKWEDKSGEEIDGNVNKNMKDNFRSMCTRTHAHTQLSSMSLTVSCVMEASTQSRKIWKTFLLVLGMDMVYPASSAREAADPWQLAK